MLHHLPPLVKQFRDRYPQVQIKLVARSHSVLMEMLSAGDLDIMLGAEPEEPSLEFSYLFTTEHVLVAPPDDDLLSQAEISLADIASRPLILLRPGSQSRRSLEQALRREGLSYNVALEMDVMEMAKRYVAIGMGIAVGHEYIVQPEDAGLVGIRSLSSILPSARIGLATLKGKFVSRSVRNFMDTLVVGLGEGSGHFVDVSGS